MAVRLRDGIQCFTATSSQNALTCTFFSCPVLRSTLMFFRILHGLGCLCRKCVSKCESASSQGRLACYVTPRTLHATHTAFVQQSRLISAFLCRCNARQALQSQHLQINTSHFGPNMYSEDGKYMLWFLK
jgi:hypothetical protein